jgi:RND superfamily putative drug exporter
VQRNDASSFLPADAESTRAIALQVEASGSDALPAVVLYERQGGLTPADLATVAAERERVIASVEVEGQVPPPIPSPDGASVQVVLPLGEDDGFALGEDVRDLRELVGSSETGGERDDGLQVWVTGPGGLQGDLLAVFETIDGTLLYATATIVVLVLLATYRSPLLWLLPIVAVAGAEITSRGAVVLLAENAGLVVNGQSAAILSVLVFGAGTDYALLLVARYREELRIRRDPHLAMRIALRQAGPAILASGSTVAAGLLCLLVADDQAVRGLGPVAAVGIVFAMLAMLTLLPALLVLTRRSFFWPLVPRFGAVVDESAGPWGRLGTRVARRPRAVWMGTVAVLRCCGRASPRSTRPACPTRRTSAGRRSRSPARRPSPVTSRSARRPRSTSSRRSTRWRGPSGSWRPTPASRRSRPCPRPVGGSRRSTRAGRRAGQRGAYDTVERLRGSLDGVSREAVSAEAPRSTSTCRRSRSATASVIIPLVSVVVLLIIVALLRSFVAPLLLLLTTVPVVRRGARASRR